MDLGSELRGGYLKASELKLNTTITVKFLSEGIKRVSNFKDEKTGKEKYEYVFDVEVDSEPFKFQPSWVLLRELAAAFGTPETKGWVGRQARLVVIMKDLGKYGRKNVFAVAGVEKEIESNP